jgi:hypothetical protein
LAGRTPFGIFRRDAACRIGVVSYFWSDVHSLAANSLKGSPAANFTIAISGSPYGFSSRPSPSASPVAFKYLQFAAS